MIKAKIINEKSCLLCKVLAGGLFGYYAVYLGYGAYFKWNLFPEGRFFSFLSTSVVAFLAFA